MTKTPKEFYPELLMKEHYLRIENKFLPIINLLGDENFLKNIETFERILKINTRVL